LAISSDVPSGPLLGGDRRSHGRPAVFAFKLTRIRVETAVPLRNSGDAPHEAGGAFAIRRKPASTRRAALAALKTFARAVRMDLAPFGKRDRRYIQ